MGTARRRLTREESHRRTRARLLDAAADVFGRRGFHAASVEEVAEAAGFSKGAVYSNFEGKDDLFLALLDRHLEQELAAVARLAAAGPSHADEPTPPEQRFPRHLEEGRAGNILAMEFWLYAMRDERARARLAARYRVARDALAASLRERYARDGAGPPAPVEHLAWGLVALGSGLALQSYLEPGALPEDLYTAAVDRLLADAPAAPGDG